RFTTPGTPAARSPKFCRLTSSKRESRSPHQYSNFENGGPDDRQGGLVQSRCSPSRGGRGPNVRAGTVATRARWFVVDGLRWSHTRVARKIGYQVGHA